MKPTTKIIQLGQYRLIFYFDTQGNYHNHRIEIKVYGEDWDWQTVPEHALSPLEKELLHELIEEYLSSWDKGEESYVWM